MQYKSKSIRVGEIILKDVWNGVFDRSRYLPAEEVLAKRYGVSRMTLRRVLGNLEKEGVLVKVAHHGTRISPQVSLPSDQEETSGQKRRIAVLIASFPDVYTIELTRGIREYAALRNATVTILQNPNGTGFLLSDVAKLKQEEYDGYVLLDDTWGRRLLEKSIRVPDVPVVFTDTVPADDSIPYVGADHFSGGYLATTVLLTKLRNGNCYFLTEKENSVSMKLHREAFLQAMSHFGYSEEAPRHVVEFAAQKHEEMLHSQHEERYLPQIRELLKKTASPCGIFAMNDYVAKAVAMAAHEQERELGKDVLIIGFGDLPFAESMGLSSIRIDRVRLGREAAETLFHWIDAGEKLRFNKIVPIQLIERRSTTGQNHSANPGRDAANTHP